jgi:hypothetical protein
MEKAPRDALMRIYSRMWKNTKARSPERDQPKRRLEFSSTAVCEQLSKGRIGEQRH